MNIPRDEQRLQGRDGELFWHYSGAILSSCTSTALSGSHSNSQEGVFPAAIHVSLSQVPLSQVTPGAGTSVLPVCEINNKNPLYGHREEDSLCLLL